MVFERMRYVDIPPDGGSMVTHASTGVLDYVYSSGTRGKYDIPGRIYKVWIDVSNTSANGSLWICASGTDEWIVYKKGSNDADSFLYPRVSICNSGGTAMDAVTAGSFFAGANMYVEPTMRGEQIYVVGSGLGNTKQINKVRVWYY